MPKPNAGIHKSKYRWQHIKRAFWGQWNGMSNRSSNIINFIGSNKTQQQDVESKANESYMKRPTNTTDFMFVSHSPDATIDVERSNNSQVARMVSSQDEYNVSVQGVSIDVSRFFERTHRLWTFLRKKKVKIRDSDRRNFSIREAKLLWHGMNELTYLMFHFLYNTVFFRATLVDNEHANDHATIIDYPPPLFQAATWYTQDSLDVLWLSPTVFISTHLYQFPSSISSFPLYTYTIQLISRDSNADAVIQVYTVDADSDINNNDNDDNHPHHSTPALHVVCLFLQRLLATVPVEYFAQINLWQQPSRAPLPSMAELRTFLSVVPPSAARLGQPVLSDRMDEITSFRVGGECDIFVFRDLANMTMNHNVRLDLWSVHIPREQLEEANTFLREMQNIPHITVPMGLNDFNSQDKSFTSNNNLQSITVSLIDQDVISTTMLKGIKNNPKIMTFRLNMYRKKMQQNIQRLCCHALDGNTSLPRFFVYIDYYDDDEDDDRESIENANHSNNYNNNNNNRVTAPIHPIDMLITVLASCKNGWSMQYIHLSKSNGELPPLNNVWDQLVAPLLSLNRFHHDTSRSDSSMMSVAHLSQTISLINNGEILRKVSNQPAYNTKPSNASVIYNLLCNNVAVYTF
jgi:hypothetical protein